MCMMETGHMIRQMDLEHTTMLMEQYMLYEILKVD
jgi:hypothetical protein